MQSSSLDWRQILIDYELAGDSRLVLHQVENWYVARSVLQEHVFNIYLVAVYHLYLYEETLFYLRMTAAATASDEFFIQGQRVGAIQVRLNARNITRSTSQDEQNPSKRNKISKSKISGAK